MSDSGASSPISSTPTHHVEVKTTLLYGVFASHKSYLIGLRNLMKREHVDMLAHKIIGKMLPPELIEIVADCLFEMEREVVQKMWIPERRAMQENIAKFEKAMVDCPALRGARDRMSLSPIKTTLVQNSRPITGQNIRLLDPPHTTYIHLSCLRPSLSINLPPRLQPPVPISPAIFYNAGNALVRVRMRGNNEARGTVHEDEVTHMPARESVGSREEPRVVGRLVQCEGVEEAVRGWDEGAVRTFVELLGLKVVPFDGDGDGDGMKPGLHFWQRVIERKALTAS